MLHRQWHAGRLANGGADQRLLQRAGRAGRIARGEIPGGGGDDLVILDAAIAHHQPVAERAARRLADGSTAQG